MFSLFPVSISRLILLLALAPLAAAFAAPSAPAAKPDWQWSVPVASVISGETQGSPRAFLWIPPGCKRLRGVVVGQHNMEEEQIFEHPVFRRALADLDFAVVWVTPPLDLFFRFDLGRGDDFDAMLKALADESGYAELSLAPVVPLGHSAAASFPWHFGFWAPERTLAAISVSGQWPYYKDKNSADWGSRTLDGVPGLVTMGEYEGAYDRASAGLRDRAANPRLPLSMLAESAGEHFSASDDKVAYIALYLRKAAQYRLPADWPLSERPKLKEIDPAKTGWLADRGRLDARPAAPAAPVGRYAGDPRDAFWFFDGELAKAAEALSSKYSGKKLQLIGYVQKDGVVPQRKSHVRVGLRLEPEADGVTFKLRGAFLDAAPADWRGLKAGDPLTHAQDASAITIDRICGPVEKLGPDTFAVRWNRVGFDNPKRGGGICFIARHPGDATYKPMSLEAELKVPLVNKDGLPQELAFDTPADVRAGVASVALKARATSGLPVYFYVREGPAYVDGDTLRFTAIPPRARFPIKVTVVAWQWGRSAEPKIRSAPPVERTFLITK